MGTEHLTPDPARYRLEDLPERISAKIQVDPDTGCWLWRGARDSKRGVPQYGLIKRPRANGRGSTTEKAHRVVWMLLVGEIAPGHQVSHIPARGCRSKACCWPLHLEPVLMGYTKGLPGGNCEHARGQS